MKKTLLFLGAMLAMLFTQNQAMAQTNLLPNGDFEAWTSGKPDKWAGKANNATLSQSTDAHSGSYAVKVGCTASQNKRLGSNELNLKAGTYKVSFWAKGGQVRPGYAIVVAGAIDGNTGYKYGEYATLSADEWTQVNYEFTLEAATTVDIIVMNPRTTANKYEAQDAIIDDFTLTTEDGGIDVVEVTWTDVTMQTLAEATASIANVNLTLTNAKVVYIDGDKTYVREGANAIQFYQTGLELPLNAEVSGTVKGNFVLYNQLPEFTAIEGETSLKDLTISNSAVPAEPTEATLAEILAMKHRCDLVILKGITVVADGTKYYASDGTNRVQFYKGLDMSSYAGDGKAYDVTGLFNNTYNKAPEIQPTAVVENSNVVPTPTFSPAAGRYESSVEVTIEVPEGCNVFYTLDGSDPDDSKTQYEAPFVITETTTVKAIAYNADDMTSAVVEATYTIYQPAPVVEGYTSTFDFDANPWSLPVSNGENQNAGNVTSIEQDGIVMSFDFDEEAGTKPRLWQVVKDGANIYVDLRLYSNQKIVITAPEGRNVLQVVFYGANKNDINLVDADEVVIDAAAISPAPESGYTKASATYTPAAPASSVTVTAKATTKLTKVDVIISVPDGIENAELSTLNSQLSTVYDLQGRRVMNAQKGVFIVNGKKVIR